MASDPKSEVPTKFSELSTRWALLALLCTALFGSYYIYDIPTAVEQQLFPHFYPTDDSGHGDEADDDRFTINYNLLYSVYSWPNIILPFFGGYISDRLGARLTMVVFLLLIFFGQIVTSIGCSMTGQTAWNVMFLGRAIFGMGGESLSVAQSAIIAKWFSGKELALALGLNLALARVGSVVNDAISIQIATRSPVYYAFWFGTFVCLISVIASIITYYVDLRSERMVMTNRGMKPVKDKGLLSYLICLPYWKSKVYEKDGASESLLSNRASVASYTSTNRKESQLSAIDAALEDGKESEDVLSKPPAEEIHMSAVMKFPKAFWLLALSCIAIYCCVLCFNNFASGFIAQKYLAGGRPIGSIPKEEFDKIAVKANTYMLITYLVAGFLAPFLGGLFDKIGYRGVANAAAGLAIVLIHVSFAFTWINPVFLLIALGICYSIYASALWPSVALLIEEKYHATAYGTVTAVQNFGLSIMPILIGTLQPSKNCPSYDSCVQSYTNVEILLVCVGAVGVLSGIMLNYVDYSSPVPVLNWTAAKADKIRKMSLIENPPNQSPVQS